MTLTFSMLSIMQDLLDIMLLLSFCDWLGAAGNAQHRLLLILILVILNWRQLLLRTLAGRVLP